MKKNPIYSIIIPVYNSNESLLELAERLDKVFLKVVKKSYEIIYIDDGSTNKETLEALLNVKKRFQENVTIIQLSRNFGKAGAVYCGFSEARGEYIITIDDDLQQLPEDIPKLVEFQERFDVVIGTFKKRKHSLLKRITSKIKKWFDYRLLGIPKTLHSTPLKLYKSFVVDSILKVNTPFPFIAGLMFNVTRNIRMVEVNHNKRKYGSSSFNFSKRLKQFSNLLINNSSFLLRIIAYIGITISLLNFFLAIFFIFKKFFIGTFVSGWTSLIVIILFIGGLMLFSIGVVGEYLIRIIKGLEHQPPFIIRRKL